MPRASTPSSAAAARARSMMPGASAASIVGGSKAHSTNSSPRSCLVSRDAWRNAVVAVEDPSVPARIVRYATSLHHEHAGHLGRMDVATEEVGAGGQGGDMVGDGARRAQQ